MPTVKEQFNKPVISTSDGRRLGKIRDVLFDAGLTRVVAISLGASGILSRKKLLIEKDRVQLCGVDAWLVPSGDVVVGPEQIAGSQEFVPARSLRGRRIVSEGGTELATVDGVIVDGECSVKGFTLAKVAASGPLAQRKAIALGAITSLGGRKQPMSTTLAQAESMEIRAQDQGPAQTPV